MKKFKDWIRDANKADDKTGAQFYAIHRSKGTHITHGTLVKEGDILGARRFLDGESFFFGENVRMAGERYVIIGFYENQIDARIKSMGGIMGTVEISKLMKLEQIEKLIDLKIPQANN